MSLLGMILEQSIPESVIQNDDQLIPRLQDVVRYWRTFV